MKLEKAIELNKESEKSLRDHQFPDYADAILISNEALTFTKLLRATGSPSSPPLFKGETYD